MHKALDSGHGQSVKFVASESCNRDIISGTGSFCSLAGTAFQWGKDESVSVTKTIPLSDSFTFQFKADAFNVFNRTHFGGITTNIASSAFGQVSNQSNTPRQLQFEGYVRF